MSGGTRRSLDEDQFLDACDRVFEGQPSPPAPPALMLTDEFEMLAQGSVSANHPCILCRERHSFVLIHYGGRWQGGVGFSDFASWAARTMCEPYDDDELSASDGEDSTEYSGEEEDYSSRDVGDWQRGKSRQYGGGGDEPPPAVVPNADDDGDADGPSAWEYRRDETTGITVRQQLLSLFLPPRSRPLLGRTEASPASPMSAQYKMNAQTGEQAWASSSDDDDET